MSTVHVSAEKFPDKLAVVFAGGGPTITYAELERRSRRLANLFLQLGCGPGDGVALLMGNEEWYFDVYWAAMRGGMHFTPINWHLQAQEIRYIVENCDAKIFVTSAQFIDVAPAAIASAPRAAIKLVYGGDIDGFMRAESALDDVPPDAPLDDPREGALMLYSSGTTGYPKGVRQPLSGAPAGDAKATLIYVAMPRLFGIEPADVYLSPAPLYHAAPLIFSTSCQRIGTTIVVMRKFDPEDALRAIEVERVTVSQWVPTHFRRMLQLPADVRAGYDLSSHRCAIHAAAPCPVPLKEAMIEWWGPIIVEYYGGTEGGGTIIRTEEWLTHKGSVGRHWSGGKVHVLDENGCEITEPRVEGGVYFEAPEDERLRFRYYKDDGKTASTYRGRLFTIGDVGYLDEDGYLYLTDRKSHMIISAGVNIYPQEVENHLSTHPNVDEVAVIGVPNEEMGEEVKAVVVVRGTAPSPELARELMEYCRASIAHFKCPRSVDFVDELPRLPNGKLLKRQIRERYWGEQTGRLI
jgi:acyl-CoA synthetase (AMP-forming)/AMP-acid ligase II